MELHGPSSKLSGGWLLLLRELMMPSSILCLTLCCLLLVASTSPTATRPPPPPPPSPPLLATLWTTLRLRPLDKALPALRGGATTADASKHHDRSSCPPAGQPPVVGEGWDATSRTATPIGFGDGLGLSVGPHKCHTPLSDCCFRVCLGCTVLNCAPLVGFSAHGGEGGSQADGHQARDTPEAHKLWVAASCQSHQQHSLAVGLVLDRHIQVWRRLAPRWSREEWAHRHFSF